MLIASQSNEAVNNVIEKMLDLSKLTGGRRPSLLRIGSKGITDRIRPFHTSALRERYQSRFENAFKTRVSSLAAAAGADRTLVPGPDTAAEIRDLTAGRGADVVLDFVGVDATIATAVASARHLGDVTVVGIGGGSFPFSFFSLPYEVSLQTTYWGTRPELAEVLELAARGLLAPKVTTHALEDAPAVYRDLAAGAVEGRAVLVP